MSSKKIIIDIGNTLAKFAVFSKDDLLDLFICSDDELFKVIQNYSSEKVIISSVRNEEFTKKVANYFASPLLLNSETPIPILNKYLTPRTLGNDRVANAVAAWSVCPEQNNLIIDVGTCLKMDFVNPKNEYLGGSISPGLRMRFKALHTLTDNLPLIEGVEINQLIGNDTTSSIQVGVYQGMVAEIRNMISQYEEKYSDLNIFLTGGDLSWFSGIELSQKNSIFADDLLTLKGLNTILNYNVQK